MDTKLPQIVNIVLYQCLNKDCGNTEIREQGDDIPAPYIICHCTAAMEVVDSGTYAQSTSSHDLSPASDPEKTLQRHIIGATSQRHGKMLEALAAFAGLDRIEYRDRGNGEDYILSKGGKTIILKARHTKDQGGFMTVDYGQESARIFHMPS